MFNIRPHYPRCFCDIHSVCRYASYVFDASSLFRVDLEQQLNCAPFHYHPPLLHSRTLTAGTVHEPKKCLTDYLHCKNTFFKLNIRRISGISIIDFIIRPAIIACMLILHCTG